MALLDAHGNLNVPLYRKVGLCQIANPPVTAVMRAVGSVPPVAYALKQGEGPFDDLKHALLLADPHFNRDQERMNVRASFLRLPARPQTYPDVNVESVAGGLFVVPGALTVGVPVFTNLDTMRDELGPGFYVTIPAGTHIDPNLILPPLVEDPPPDHYLLRPANRMALVQFKTALNHLVPAPHALSFKGAVDPKWDTFDPDEFASATPAVSTLVGALYARLESSDVDDGELELILAIIRDIRGSSFDVHAPPNWALGFLQFILHEFINETMKLMDVNNEYDLETSTSVLMRYRALAKYYSDLSAKE